MTDPRELSMRLRQPRWRPLADTDCVKWALDMTAEDIERLIDLGCVVVFDISVKMENHGRSMLHRRELRFLTRSIEHYRLTLGMRNLDMSWPQIAQLILPPDSAVLTSAEIDSALNCDSNHRLNLIRAGELEPSKAGKKFRKELWCRGRNCGAAVTRRSLENFLRRRRL